MTAERELVLSASVSGALASSPVEFSDYRSDIRHLSVRRTGCKPICGHTQQGVRHHACEVRLPQCRTSPRCSPRVSFILQSPQTTVPTPVILPSCKEPSTRIATPSRINNPHQPAIPSSPLASLPTTQTPIPSRPCTVPASPPRKDISDRGPSRCQILRARCRKAEHHARINAFVRDREPGHLRAMTGGGHGIGGLPTQEADSGQVTNKADGRPAL